MICFKRTRGFIIIYILIFIVLLKFIQINKSPIQEISPVPKLKFVENIKSLNFNSCPIPKYEDFSRLSKEHILLNNLQCPKTPDLVKIKNGKVIIINNYTCTYQCILWKTDFDYELSQAKELKNFQRVPCQYFVVFSIKAGANLQLIMSPMKYEHLMTTSNPIVKDTKKLQDVLILGIDSMSYLSYKKYLPKTFGVLHNELKGVSFKKFNTLGDGTTINLQGLLTGTKDTETYESRKRISGAKTVDNYNWIWNYYKELGYLTQFYDEMTEYGTFQYRLLGFEKQPTDIYLRTLLMYAERTKYSKNFCLGNKPQHSEILKFYKESLRVNGNMPTFSFVYFCSTSHDDNKYVSYLDEDLANFLVETRQNNPKMTIILYADHGHRFNSRLSMQGKYEERLPFLGVSLSEDLEHLLQVLKSNSEVLISGLDVHATLEDIIGIYNPEIRNRHMSLLRPLPKDRSCEDIEAAPHWCVCLNWKEIVNPNLDKKVIKIAEIVVEQISNFTLPEREFCAELKLDRIKSLHKTIANKEVLKFKQSADVDGFVPDLSDNTSETDTWYKVVLKTKPADAIFEVTVSVRYENVNDSSHPKVGTLSYRDISRINRYAPWIKCLQRIKSASKISDIRKFCICKDSL